MCTCDKMHGKLCSFSLLNLISLRINISCNLKLSLAGAMTEMQQLQAFCNNRVWLLVLIPVTAETRHKVLVKIS